jgi:ubiquinone/menaquinone biosynthesis C-methylase UbiE
MSINEYYESGYSKVVESGAVGRVASIYHKMLEKGHNGKFEICLEIGAGTAQHFKYVQHDFEKYISSDLRNPGENLKRISDTRHEFKQINAENLLGIKDKSIDRLIATCVLPHLNNPESALIEWARVVKAGGVLDIYVPCEPSLMLGIAQRFTTKRKVEKLGWDYERIQYREHRNHYPMLKMLLEEIFENDKIEVRNFPPGVRFWQLGLFRTYRIFKAK